MNIYNQLHNAHVYLYGNMQSEVAKGLKKERNAKLLSTRMSKVKNLISATRKLTDAELLVYVSKSEIAPVINLLSTLRDYKGTAKPKGVTQLLLDEMTKLKARIDAINSEVFKKNNTHLPVKMLLQQMNTALMNPKRPRSSMIQYLLELPVDEDIDDDELQLYMYLEAEQIVSNMGDKAWSEWRA